MYGTYMESSSVRKEDPIIDFRMLTASHSSSSSSSSSSHKIINKLSQTHLLLCWWILRAGRKQERAYKCWLVSEKKLDKISAMLEHCT
jgi:hypothetical protein